MLSRKFVFFLFYCMCKVIELTLVCQLNFLDWPKLCALFFGKLLRLIELMAKREQLSGVVTRKKNDRST